MATNSRTSWAVLSPFVRELHYLRRQFAVTFVGVPGHCSQSLTMRLRRDVVAFEDGGLQYVVVTGKCIVYRRKRLLRFPSELGGEHVGPSCTINLEHHHDALEGCEVGFDVVLV